MGAAAEPRRAQVGVGCISVVFRLYFVATLAFTLQRLQAGKAPWLAGAFTTTMAAAAAAASAPEALRGSKLATRAAL